MLVAKSDCDDSSTQSVLDTGGDILDLDTDNGNAYEGNAHAIGGTVRDKGNVAVYAKEDAYQRELMKCGDDRGLTIWYDKDQMWKTFKEKTFLIDDSDKWISISLLPGSGSVGGVSRDASSALFLGPAANCTEVAIPVGSAIFRKIISDMEKKDRLPDILGVDSRISLIVRVPLILRKDQVCLEAAKEKGIPFELDNQNVILYLKALLDSGASDNLVAEESL